jgi:hypothetical protein
VKITFFDKQNDLIAHLVSYVYSIFQVDFLCFKRFNLVYYVLNVSSWALKFIKFELELLHYYLMYLIIKPFYLINMFFFKLCNFFISFPRELVASFFHGNEISQVLIFNIHVERHLKKVRCVFLNHVLTFYLAYIK